MYEIKNHDSLVNLFKSMHCQFSILYFIFSRSVDSIILYDSRKLLDWVNPYYPLGQKRRRLLDKMMDQPMASKINFEAMGFGFKASAGSGQPISIPRRPSTR